MSDGIAVNPTPTRRLTLRRRGPATTTGRAWVFVLGLVMGGTLLLAALLAPLLGLDDPGASDLTNRLAAPGTAGHLLGTDQLGRDVLSRTLAGARWSLGIGLIAATIGVVIGTVLGIAAAWVPGILRPVLVRAIDVGLSFPSLVIAISILAIVGRGFLSLAICLGLICWPPVARVVYAQSLGLKEREFVVAARLAGVRPVVLVVTHVLPALGSTIQVMSAFIFAEMMIAESGMSFLGLGAPLGAPTWGSALSESRSYLATAPWMMLAPAAAIVTAVMAANFIGDGLAQRQRQRGAGERG